MFVSGSNIHGQWYTNQNLINNFQDITSTINTYCSNNFNLKTAKLEVATWSYNIFRSNNVFFISGAWCGKENTLIEVTLPEKCNNTDSNLILVGNDYKLFLINIRTFELWFLSFNEEWNWQYKVINSTDIDTDCQETVSKKNKIDKFITKAIATHSCLCLLTSKGQVLELPHYIDTKHCKGKVCDIDLGYEHGILLTDVGKIYTWGNGRRCQLGHGDLMTTTEPTEVEALAGIKISKVKAGGWHCLALSEQGDLYSWGWNDSGQLGIKDSKSHPLPTVVDLYEENGMVLDVNVKDIACGSKHSAILLEDKTLWTTGCNKYGQTGFCTESNESINYFRKTSNCCYDGRLLCGPWCTILDSQILVCDKKK